MTTEKQFAACAELDGYSQDDSNYWSYWNGKDRVYVKEIPNYNSRDVLVPLIEKQFDGPAYRTQFQVELSKLTYTDSLIDHAKAYFCASPSQLREALLRATGRWKE